eukprot:scaffold1199_cov265-Pinguiococcus_pyrenoidosus.AAC.39
MMLGDAVLKIGRPTAAGTLPENVLNPKLAALSSVSTLAPTTAPAAAFLAESMKPLRAFGFAQNVLMVMNLPLAADEDDLKELLTPFGELRAFKLLLDAEGNSKGTALFEYREAAVGLAAINGLNGLPLGEVKLVAQELAPTMAATLLAPMIEKKPSSGNYSSQVVRLSNMATRELLADPQEYQDIKEDVEEECGNYGKVVGFVMPKPNADSTDDEAAAGVGNIFVRFESEESAKRAIRELQGRPFDGRKVVATHYPLRFFKKGFFSNKDAEELFKQAEAEGGDNDDDDDDDAADDMETTEKALEKSESSGAPSTSVAEDAKPVQEAEPDDLAAAAQAVTVDVDADDMD